MIINAKVIFTDHAKERIKECQHTEGELIKFLDEATEERLPKDIRRDKAEKYHGNGGISYYRYGPLIYTTRWMIDRFTDKPLLLVITVTNQLACVK